MTGQAEQKAFASPDEVRSFERGEVRLLKIGGGEIGQLILQPGWRWSEHVKPIAGTELCEAPHFQYHVQGTLHIVMADGSEFDARAGDVTALPQGHDAWVVGDEPVSWSTGSAPATTRANGRAGQGASVRRGDAAEAASPRRRSLERALNSDRQRRCDRLCEAITEGPSGPPGGKGHGGRVESWACLRHRISPLRCTACAARPPPTCPRSRHSSTLLTRNT